MRLSVRKHLKAVKPLLKAYNMLSDEERKEEYVWILEQRNPQFAECFFDVFNQST